MFRIKYLITGLIGTGCIAYVVRKRHNDGIFKQHKNYERLWFPLRSDFHKYICEHPDKILQIHNIYIDEEMILTSLSTVKDHEYESYQCTTRRIIKALDHSDSEDINSKLINKLEELVITYPDCIMDIPEKYITERMCWKLIGTLVNIYTICPIYAPKMNGINYRAYYPSKIPKRLMNGNMRAKINMEDIADIFPEKLLSKE